MSLRVVRQYRYENRSGYGIGVVADWQCETCGRIVYPETHVMDVPQNEVRDGCRRCQEASETAYRVATEWWEKYSRLFYRSKVWGSTGFYGLRDDLLIYLARGVASDELKRFVRRNRVDLPPVDTDR
jgi:hypothetical protein